MKQKYITKQILLACRARPLVKQKDIHEQLKETISERKKIMEQWEKLFLPEQPAMKKDVHAELRETIAEHRKIMQQWEKFFRPRNESTLLTLEKKAA